MKKPNCPSCNLDLTGFKIGEAIGWQCSKCDGRAVNLTVFKSVSDPKKIQKFWVEALKEAKASAKKCPACSQLMKRHTSQTQLGNIELDLCSICQFFWFDREELNAMPAKVAEEQKFGTPRETSHEAKYGLKPGSSFFFGSVLRVLR